MRLYIISLLILMSLVPAVRSEGGAVENPKSVPTHIPFGTFDDALRESQESKKPLVVYFTATWCSWCQKMSAGPMKSPEVLALSPHYVWAKADLDASPFLASVFQVRSVPALRVINGEGQTLGAHSGYMTEYQLKTLLETYKDGFNAEGKDETTILKSTRLYDQLKAQKGKLDAELVTEAITAISRPKPPMKRVITETILSYKHDVWPLLLNHMESDKVAVRATACSLLKQSTGRPFVFDPFAVKTARSAQLNGVRAQVNTLLKVSAASESVEPN